LTMEMTLRMKGLGVIYHSFPSRRLSLREAGEQLATVLDGLPARSEEGRLRFSSSARVGFVTHSYGALVLREALSLRDWQTPSRAVLIGPPNRGSELARRLKRLGAGAILGQGGGFNDLAREPDELDARLGPLPPAVRCRLIVSSLGWNPLLSGLPNDGVVCLKDTPLPRPRVGGLPPDVLSVAAPHTLMLWHWTVCQETARFLTDT
jgi:triacylglycerol lipase